jgi:hypothetical protein
LALKAKPLDFSTFKKSLKKSRRAEEASSERYLTMKP